jgi:hypothetical protein
MGKGGLEKKNDPAAAVAAALTTTGGGGSDAASFNVKGKRREDKKSGEYMMAAPVVHVDESFWLLALAWMCYRWDFWAVGFMALEPLLVHVLCRAVSTPGDKEHACNNIIPVDLRKEFSTPPEVLESIAGGKFVEADEAARPNSDWVRCFQTSLAPDSMDHLDRKQQRLLYVLSQGGSYLPKASNLTLAMCLYSVAIGALTLGRLGSWQRVARYVAIVGTHINLLHILRDHSVSGLTHHGAHNVGEFDKAEFIKDTFRCSAPWVAASCLPVVGGWPVVQMMAALFSVKCLAFVNHTLTHYTRIDIKGKGPLRGRVWGWVLDCQELLAACKVITSKQYHAAHHFHNEMSYPAILMPVNEYLNAKSLTPFLTRTMDGKRLAQVEKLLTAVFIVYLYSATTAAV